VVLFTVSLPDGISLHRALKHAAHYARQRGMRQLIVKLARTFVGGRERWYVTSGDLASWTQARRRNPSIDVRLARADDLPALARFGRQQHDTLRLWLERGYFFFVAVADGQLVGYRCLAPRPHPWVQDYFRLRPHQIYGLDLFTLPAWRGRGLTWDLMAVSNPVLLAHGYREILSIQRTDNAESIATTRARGIQRLGTLERRSFLGRATFRFVPAA
jgi:GNAT superfamily N-acetyltransferase